MSNPPSTQVKILRSREELEPLIPGWIDVLIHPQTHPELFFRLCDADDVILNPYVPVELNPDGSIRGMMVSRLEYSKYVRAGRYVPLPQPMTRTVVVPFDGIIGTDPVGSAPNLLAELMRHMDNGEADAVELPFFPFDDPIRERLLEDPSKRFRTATPTSEVHWHFDIDDDFDSQLKQLRKSTRSTLRHNLNRFRRELDGQFEIRWYGPDSDLEELLRFSEEIALQSYHRGLEVGFSLSKRTRAIYEAAHHMGTICCQVLLIDNTPAAFLHAFKWHDRLFGTFMGHARGFTKIPIGTVLLFETLRTLCEEGHYKTWDFGPGEAEYKSRLCSRRIEEEQRTIFARTLRAQRIRITATSFRKFETMIKGGLKRVGLEQKLKTILRNRKRQDQRDTPSN